MFFCVFIIMYLKNALLDMCYFLIFGHICNWITDQLNNNDFVEQSATGQDNDVE